MRDDNKYKKLLKWYFIFMGVVTFIGLVCISRATAQWPYGGLYISYYPFAPSGPQPGYFFNNYNSNYNNQRSEYVYPPWAQFPWTPGPAYTPPGVLEQPRTGYGASSSEPVPPMDWSMYWPIPDEFYTPGPTGPLLVPRWEPYPYIPSLPAPQTDYYYPVGSHEPGTIILGDIIRDSSVYSTYSTYSQEEDRTPSFIRRW